MRSVDFELEEMLSRYYTSRGYTTEMVKNDIKALFGYTEAKPLIERKREFKEQLKPFLATYPEQMIVEFFEYWTEHSPKGRLMKFEKESTFDISRRLAKWQSNQKKFSIVGMLNKGKK